MVDGSKVLAVPHLAWPQYLGAHTTPGGALVAKAQPGTAESNLKKGSGLASRASKNENKSVKTGAMIAIPGSTVAFSTYYCRPRFQRTSLCSPIAPVFRAKSSSKFRQTLNRGQRFRLQFTMALHDILLSQAVSNDAFTYFLSGGISSTFSHGITVPIDVVKTRLQTDDSLRSSGMIHATATIVRKEGISALSIGLGSTLIGYAIKV